MFRQNEWDSVIYVCSVNVPTAIRSLWAETFYIHICTTLMRTSSLAHTYTHTHTQSHQNIEFQWAADVLGYREIESEWNIKLSLKSERESGVLYMRECIKAFPIQMDATQ